MSVKPVRQIESRVKRKKKKVGGVGFDGGERERERGEGAHGLPYTRLAALFPDDLAPSSLPCPVGSRRRKIGRALEKKPNGR